MARILVPAGSADEPGGVTRALFRGPLCVLHERGLHRMERRRSRLLDAAAGVCRPPFVAALRPGSRFFRQSGRPRVCAVGFSATSMWTAAVLDSICSACRTTGHVYHFDAQLVICRSFWPAREPAMPGRLTYSEQRRSPGRPAANKHVATRVWVSMSSSAAAGIAKLRYGGLAGSSDM